MSTSFRVRGAERLAFSMQNADAAATVPAIPIWGRMVVIIMGMGIMFFHHVYLCGAHIQYVCNQTYSQH